MRQYMLGSLAKNAAAWSPWSAAFGFCGFEAFNQIINLGFVPTVQPNADLVARFGRLDILPLDLQ